MGKYQNITNTKAYGFFYLFLEREKQHNIIVNSYLCVSGQ